MFFQCGMTRMFGGNQGNNLLGFFFFNVLSAIGVEFENANPKEQGYGFYCVVEGFCSY